MPFSFFDSVNLWCKMGWPHTSLADLEAELLESVWPSDSFRKRWRNWFGHLQRQHHLHIFNIFTKANIWKMIRQDLAKNGRQMARVIRVINRMTILLFRIFDLFRFRSSNFIHVSWLFPRLPWPACTIKGQEGLPWSAMTTRPNCKGSWRSIESS